MKHLIILFAYLLLIDVAAQHTKPDTIKTQTETLVIHPIQHATLALEWNDTMVYADPTGDLSNYKGLKAPDILLITDIHGDHMSPTTLAKMDLKKTVIIAPKAVAESLSKDYTIIVLQNGETSKQKNIQISAIPMYNLPESPDARHTKGRGNGYVLKSGDLSVYISGDTEDIPEMRALKGIDVAFICMNLPYTMNVEQAADGTLAFKPRIVYPFHYKGSDIEEFKRLVNKGDSSIEVRLRDWYPE